ncbi:heparinase II/III family protein [Microbacterium sp. STN6]|uniref:heparinase II/III domain-containing protein n=1 Tax=Microbacterium sp. STN6 TaxID=2995588 RepID=UPI0022608EDC|nr:heparinase II/III family protein [Microbacterium sp. STN6]MCX7520895.1 heparinase II/III family protein [Microbacterium sp. STN6]
MTPHSGLQGLDDRADDATGERFRGPLAEHWGERALPAALVDLIRSAPRASNIASSTDRPAWQSRDSATLAAVSERANLELGTAWPQPLMSHYSRYFREGDGDRAQYESLVADRQHRLTRAVLMAAFTDDPRWIDEAGDGIALLCEQSSWSWAAHDDTFTAQGHVVPTASSPYLDLGAGEVAAQLAWADVVLGDRLDERIAGLRERMRHETRLRVIEPFLTRRDWHWLGLDGDVHNWNPWIHGNVTLAALFLVDDRQQRAEVVARAIEGLDRYLASLPPDGAIDEGFAYWWNGAGRALEMVQTLEDATGGALDATGIRVIHAVTRFPHRMHLGGDWYVNHADGSARRSPALPWHMLQHWGRRLGDEEAAAQASAHRVPGAPVADEGAGLGRMLRALFDEHWVHTRPGTAPLVQRTWLPSVQVLVTRQKQGSTEGLALAVKGGHNGEHHNHNDVGSYIIALDGRPRIVDAGQPTYTAQTFGPRRYEIRVMQSGWHNTPSPLGVEQRAGDRYRATEVTPVTDAAADALRMQLASAYDLGEGASWRREARLDRSAELVVVTDEWRLPATPGAPFDGVRINHLLAGVVRLIDGGAAAVVGEPEGGRELVLRWHGSGAGGAGDGGDGGGAVPVTAAIERWELDDPLLVAVWGSALSRLVLSIPAVGDRRSEGVRGSMTMTIGAGQ